MKAGACPLKAFVRSWAAAFKSHSKQVRDVLLRQVKKIYSNQIGRKMLGLGKFPS